MPMRNVEEETFVKTIELGSIRAAARALGQEPSSVSRRLTQLEVRLGTKLIERASGAARATEAGLRYYRKVSDLLAQMTALEAEISGEVERPSGLLKVTSAIDFGQSYLTDWLLDFKAMYPEVDVELNLSSRNVDLVTTGTDVAIRVGMQQDSSLIARKLADVPRVLVASPAYLDRHGTPRTPADLATHQFIFFQPENRQQPLLLTGPDGKAYKIKRQGGVTVNAVHSVVKAVGAGFGVHGGPHWAFADALDRGDVVALLPDYGQPVPPLLALRAPAVIVPAKVREFLDFLEAKVADVPGLLPIRRKQTPDRQPRLPSARS